MAEEESSNKMANEESKGSDPEAIPRDGRDAEEIKMPMIEAAEDCLAQSLLVFLFADLRLLSATGRIRTNFENFVIASDEYGKLSATALTGAPYDLEKLSSSCTNEGISPAQIMASLMVETRKEILDYRKKSADAETSMFSTILDAKGRREYEDGMHALFRANYEMIGRDLKADIPAFKAKDFPDFERKGVGLFCPPHANMPDITEQIDNVKDEAAQAVDKVKDEATQAVDKVKSFVRRVSGSNKKLLQRTTEGGANTITEEGRRGAWESEQGPMSDSGRTANRSSLRQSASRHFSPSRRRSSKSTGRGGLCIDTIQDVGDAFFTMSGGIRPIPEESNEGDILDSTDTVPEDVLLNMMEEAVESREYDKLDFLASFFKDRSVSQLVILSKARIVWMNDWYPLKDCTYAISVDPGKKEVLVVFRGAITRADWGHATDYSLKKVPNPLKDEYDGKPETIDLHHGFHRYLFRERKDTGTTKYDEIANVLHHFGSQMGEYKVVVTGHSLGGALTTVFSLWASCDERFTRNGPVKMYTFGAPHVAGQSFVHVFRHQERMKKLLLARFYNERDGIVFMPISWIGEYQHLGLSIKMPYTRPFLWRCLQREHKVYYAKESSFCGFYARGLRNNYFLNMPLPWKIRKVHSLAELQKRLIKVRKKIQQYDEKHGTNDINATMEELYERFVYD